MPKNRSRSRASRLGIAILLSIAPLSARAGAACDFLAPWAGAERAKPAHPSSIREAGESVEAVAAGIRSSADALYRLYRKGEVDERTLDDCFRSEGLDASPDFDAFRNAVPGAFFRASLAEFLALRGPVTESFARALDERARTGNLVLFRLTGHSANLASPTDEKAGFHRGERSIFMDFGRIPANEWLLIFAHEYAHSLDPALSDAMPIFADPELRAKVDSLSRRTENVKALSPEELADLDRWLIAGLDRGYLAEVRAWALSFAIYEEGLADGAWKPIAWMDSMLRDRRRGETAIVFAARYLAPRFTDPEPTGVAADLFSRVLVRTRLKQIRIRLRSGEIAISPVL